MQCKSGRIFAVVLLVAAAGCQDKVQVPQAVSPFRLTATIQDIMVSEVDPAADYLWDAVSTTITAAGTDEHQPRTPEEWLQARHRAITLIEATNLLVMEGRRVAAPGKKLEDEGADGILTAAEAQKAIDGNRAAFVQYAHALHDVGEQMLTAIDAKSPKGMEDAGGAMDAVCEACHTTFWYPNQGTAELPN